MSRLIFIGLIFISTILYGQQEVQIFIDTELAGSQQFKDSLDYQAWAQNQLWKWWSAGYLFASLDSLKSGKVYFHRGRRFSSAGNLYFKEPDNQEYHASDFRKPTNLIKWYSNHGYPFASIRLDSVSIRHETYSGFYTLDEGPYIKNDSIVLLNEVPVNRSYLASVLDMQKGKAFSERNYRSIGKKLDRISFLTLKGTPDISFEDGRSTIYLHLKEESSSSFEGVLGLQPNQAPGGGLSLTGYLDLTLGNLFQQGIGLDASWNRFADQSQDILIGYYHPYFLSSGTFLDFDFSLLKQDTTFITREWAIGMGIHLAADIGLHFLYRNAGGNLISGSISDLSRGFADYQTDFYTLRLGNNEYDYPFGFGNHFRYNSSISLGDKTLLKNGAIASDAYDSLQLNTLMFGALGAMKYQFTLFRRLAFFQEISGSTFINDQILRNEISRLGGLRSARGFNENFFFAQHYTLSRLELRQYFEERSYFMLFYDQLFYALDKKWDQPLGFGGGINLNTSNGLFTFALAVGTSESIPLDFANIKVHFGYTSRF